MLDLQYKDAFALDQLSFCYLNYQWQQWFILSYDVTRQIVDNYEKEDFKI